MPFNYEQLMMLSAEGSRSNYGDRDTILYALGVGMGRDPLNENELAYVYEKGGVLKTIPTMATLLSQDERLIKESGAEYSKVVHGEQYLTLHRPLAPADEIITDSRISKAYDKGAGKGALIYIENKLYSAKDNQPVATVTSVMFARGDGGFGGLQGGGEAVHELPARRPDQSVRFETRADQALLYRLNGDRNPLHADPSVARQIGFPVPILHGLCSYGIACRAVLAVVCNYDPSRIVEFNARFSAPVYPGETIITDIWVDGKIVSFRCRLKERDVTAISNGRCTLA